MFGPIPLSELILFSIWYVAKALISKPKSMSLSGLYGIEGQAIMVGNVYGPWSDFFHNESLVLG